MTEHDPFERELRAGLAAEPAPEALQRRIAQIPLEHLRPRRARNLGGISRRLHGWLSLPNASWAGGFAAAAVSLAIGFWLGFAGLTAVDTGNGEDELAALVFSGVPTVIGEAL